MVSVETFVAFGSLVITTLAALFSASGTDSPEVRLEEGIEELDAGARDDHADRILADHRLYVGEEWLSIDIGRVCVPRRESLVEDNHVLEAAPTLCVALVKEQVVDEERDGELAGLGRSTDREIEGVGEEVVERESSARVVHAGAKRGEALQAQHDAGDRVAAAERVALRTHRLENRHDVRKCWLLPLYESVLERIREDLLQVFATEERAGEARDDCCDVFGARDPCRLLDDVACNIGMEDEEALILHGQGTRVVFAVHNDEVNTAFEQLRQYRGDECRLAKTRRGEDAEMLCEMLKATMDRRSIGALHTNRERSPRPVRRHDAKRMLAMKFEIRPDPVAHDLYGFRITDRGMGGIDRSERLDNGIVTFEFEPIADAP